MVSCHATCAELLAGDAMLLGPPELGLLEGLLVSSALVHVSGGTVYMLVVNVGTSDGLFFSTQGVLARVHIINLPAGATEVRPATIGACSQAMQVAGFTVPGQIIAVDL